MIPPLTHFRVPCSTGTMDQPATEGSGFTSRLATMGEQFEEGRTAPFPSFPQNITLDGGCDLIMIYNPTDLPITYRPGSIVTTARLLEPASGTVNVIRPEDAADSTDRGAASDPMGVGDVHAHEMRPCRRALRLT